MDVKLPDTKNAIWKNDKTRFGYKFLSKFGWSDDKGLGKDESGSTSSIAVSKREESLGLGAEKVTDGAGAKGWSETQKGFNAVLEALKSEYGDSKSKKSKRAKDKKKKEKEKRLKSDETQVDENETKITVGIKYKKFSEAKALKGKSEVDMRAVLGLGKRSSDNTDSHSDSETKKKDSKRKRDKAKECANTEGDARPDTKKKNRN